MPKKNCKFHQILNPKTKRCVKKSGKIGKSILKKKTSMKQVNKKKTTKKQVNKKISKSARVSSKVSPKSLKSKLIKLKLKEYPVPGDGNCQFHSLAYVINKNKLGKITYNSLRKEVVNYLQKHKKEFENFIPLENSKVNISKNFKNYVEQMSKNKVYGDNLTLYVISLLYNLKIIVLRHNRKNNIINEAGKNIIYVVYHGDDGFDAHYNATVNNKQK
jgi:hypothetical protein